MAIVSSGQISLTDLNDAKQVLLYLSPNYKSQIYDPNTGSYNPNFTGSNLTITPQLYVAGNGTNLIPSAQIKSVTWYEGAQTTTALTDTTTGTTPAGYSYSIAAGAANTVAKTLTIKSNITAGHSAVYTCVVVYTDPDTGLDITCQALVEISKITNGVKGANGTNAVTVYLSNDSAVVPTDENGNNGVYSATGTDIHVYEGTTELTYDGKSTSNGTWTVTATGTSITAGSITDSGLYATVGPASNISADAAYITFTITGKSLSGVPINMTTKQSISRAKTGVAPTAYWLVSDATTIKKDVSGKYNPTSINLTGKSQKGGGSPANYSGRFKVEEDTGSGYTTKYTSASDEATHTHSVSTSGLKSIRVSLYQAGGTSTLLDQQTINIISDGAAGVDSYYLNVWAPNGDTIRNSAGTIDIQADLYKGSGTVTPTAYKWYIQNPNATTSSLGDADGGNGWELLTSSNTHGVSNYSSAKITVPSSAINGVEGFKCVATAPSTGAKYSGVIIVRDFQDPIVTNIIGQNVFKNGQGSVTLQAKLLQAGTEISTAGYTFAWALYDSAGNLIKTYATTGDTITVPSTDVTGTANLVCDVSK